MDIRQIQNELKALELLNDSEAVINDIMTATEGVEPMNERDRKAWIQDHAMQGRLRLLGDADYELIFCEEISNETLKLPPNAYGIRDDDSGLGAFLLKKYSVNKIVVSCTLYMAYNGKETNAVLYHGAYPILRQTPKKLEEVTARQGGNESRFWREASASVSVQKIGTNDVMVANSWQDEFIRGTSTLEQIRQDAPPSNLIQEGKDLSERITNLHSLKQELPLAVFTLSEQQRKDLSKFAGECRSIKVDDADFAQAVLQSIPSDGSYMDKWDLFDYNYPNNKGDDVWVELRQNNTLLNPVKLIVDGKSFFFPAQAIKLFLNTAVGLESSQEFRIWKSDNGIILDASAVSFRKMTIPIDGELREVSIPEISPIALEIKDYNVYPSTYVTIDLANFYAKPMTAEEFELSQVEVLTLPNAVLARQMRVPYGDKRLPMSAVSLDKWSKSTQSYSDAVELMNEHLGYYTKLNEVEVRVNNNAIYEQTRTAVASRLTKNGKVNEARFREIMSKYAYTIEETFFNLNPDFSDPEKLLGYFLGMGIKPNALYQNDVSPYRLLCARLLGIDYAVNYLALCKRSCVKGHLFIDEFDEDDKPVFTSADTWLDKNIFLREYTLKDAKFLEKVNQFFGDDAPDVLEHHENLLKEFSPKFMKLYHGTRLDYEKLVRNKGVGKAYLPVVKSKIDIEEEEGQEVASTEAQPFDMSQEVTRITTTNGIITDEFVRELNMELLQAGHGKPSPSFLNRASEKFKEEFDVNTYDKPARLQDASYYYMSKTGNDLFGRASDKLRYNSLDKSESIRSFYEEPDAPNEGPWRILANGITITNKELGDNDDERKTLIIRHWRSNDAINRGGWSKVNTENMQYVLAGYGNDLRDLGYEDSDRRALAKIIADRAIGLYREIKSQAMVDGAELHSLGVALASPENEVGAYEKIFNLKYNNFSLPPISRVPIFLENMRHFGDLSKFVSDSYQEDGRLAGFSLREAQKEGLRFLGAKGNSGLLAHEVGFGKTTSSIAKVSDLFLRGDAKRVLISVPNPVYGSGNWEAEIRGARNEDGRKKSNGLLPSNINLVKLGSLKYSDLLGSKITPDNPEYAEKSEGTGYDGPMLYSESDMKLIETINKSSEKLIDIVGGAVGRYGEDDNSAITPRLIKYGLGREYDWRYIERNPFFKKYEDADKANLVRLNGVPRQELTGTTTIKSGDFDFWDIGTSTYMELGQIADITDGSVANENSLIKSVYSVMKEIVPDLEVDDVGGDLEILFGKLQVIHDKYKRGYDELSQDGTMNIQKRSAPMLGGEMFPRGGKKFKDEGGNDIREFDWDGKTAIGIKKEATAKVIADELFEVYKNNKDPKKKVYYWPFLMTRSYYEKIVAPWAMEKIDGGISRDGLRDALLQEFTFFDYNNKSGGRQPDEMKAIALGQIKTALELQMTEEIAFFFKILKEQLPFYLGKFKGWASRDNTILLCSHLAIPKISVSQKFAERSIGFMMGIYDKAQPRQRLHFKDGVNVAEGDGNAMARPFDTGIMSKTQKEKMFLSQYRGLDVRRLNTDALVVDEVHNFNRAFKVVKKGSKSSYSYGIRAHMKGKLGRKDAQWVYDTFANYDIRGEVQNFIALCMYFQDRANYISEGLKRKIQNTIFLSATPFTDDNFQMLSLFGALSTEKLMQANVFNTFDFFQLYANELWQKDIDYQNKYSLFPKIASYKNVYALSQMIRSFTNFKISDAEIEADRPQKVVVGTDAPQLKGVQDDALSKVLSQVPYNDVQQKMNDDLEKYITLQSESELTYKKEDIEKAEKIFEKLNKKKGKATPADPLVKELKTLLDVKSKKVKKKTIIVDVAYELEDYDRIEELLDEILEIDEENQFANDVRRFMDSSFSEGAEGEDVDDDDDDDDDDTEESVNAGSVKNASLSQAQQIAQRALEASRTQQLVLISPYYLTINNDKKLMNPYLPTLDGTMSENAKNVVENSPKLLYACKAIAKVLNHAINEKKQVLADSRNPILGQVVYANNYKFRYHGQDFFLFDLMTQYIIDNNKDLLKQTGKTSDEELRSLFASIDGRTKKIKDPETGVTIDEKSYITEQFNAGNVLVLFGTETIREGINLQKNCPLMYILQVGFVPVTYMQLHGRIWRQKNPYKYAFLVNVLTQNSIDAFVYSKLDQKIQSVREMLEGDVYDGNTTQFDVNVSEIKTKLINDPVKLADMQWEDLRDELSRQKDRFSQELTALQGLESSYPRAVEAYKENSQKINGITKLIHDCELYFTGKLFANMTNRKRQDAEIDKLVATQYPAQFGGDDQLMQDFEKEINSGMGLKKEFLNKDGSAKYKTRKEIADDVRPNVTITEMTIDEAMEEVKRANASDEVTQSQFRLSIIEPTYFEETTSLSSFVTDCQNIDDDVISSRAKQNKEMVGKERTEWENGVLEPAQKIVEASAIGEDAVREIIDTFSMNQTSTNVRKVRLIFALASVMQAGIVDRPQDWGTLPFYGLYNKFKSGEEAESISAFNDIVASQKVGEKSATLEDIPKLIEEKTKAEANFESRLNNESAEKDKLVKYFEEKINQKKGEKIPSVEDRVNDLEALFPYLIRTR